MINRGRNLLIAVVLLFAPAGVIVANPCQAVSIEKKNIYFVNGVLTSLIGAHTALRELREGLSETSGDATFDLAYNYTHGPILDFLQAAQQHDLDFNHSVMLWLSKAGLAPEWFVDWYRAVSALPSTVIASDVKDHVEKYRDALWQGHRVLLVAHSQGNFYANEARDLLGSYFSSSVLDESFAIFAVASPSSHVGGKQGPYLTNHRDIIRLVPDALAPNWMLHHTETGQPADDVGGVEAHSFVGAYLSTKYDVQGALISGLNAELARLIQPRQTEEDGPIKVHVSWSPNDVDVDLIMIEVPDGAGLPPVLQRQGISGYTSGDSFMGDVGEEYKTGCNQLSLGTYYIAVAYMMDILASVPPSHPDCPSNDSALGSKPYCASISSGTLSAMPRETTSVVSVQLAGNPLDDLTVPLQFFISSLPWKITVDTIQDDADINRIGKLKFTLQPSSIWELQSLTSLKSSATSGWLSRWLSQY